MKYVGLLATFFSLLLSGGARAETPGESPVRDVSDEGPPHIVPRHFLRADGRRIESGLRIETLGDRVRVARRVFPDGGEPSGFSLPSHLGGGYLFYHAIALEGSTYTAFYRADTWTGVLKPLRLVPFSAEVVAPGFDRIYLIGVSLRAALDPRTGEILSLDPLPPLPTISEMAFQGPRRGLVSGPLVGTLYSNDAGLTWRPVEGVRSVQVDLDRRDLFVSTDRGLSVVDEEGEPVPVRDLDLDRAALRTIEFERLLGGHSRSKTFDTGGAQAAVLGPATRDHLERRWVRVLTSGAPFSKHAWAIDEGQLLRLSLDDALEFRSLPTTVSPSSTCVGTVDETDPKATPLFVCKGEGLQVLRLDRRAADDGPVKEGMLKPVWEGGVKSRLVSWGAGGALFSGDCGGKGDAGSFCHVGRSGARALRLPATPSMKATLSAFATTNRGAELMWFDRKARTVKARALSDVSAKPARIRAWKVPKDHAISDFLREGAMLPRGSRTSEGLTFWATHREKFVGVLLGDGEKLSFGAVQRPLRRALFDGPRALVWGAAGFAKQTTDGGQTFDELSLPYRSGDSELSVVQHSRSSVIMGCSAAGCSLGRFLKMGWVAPKPGSESFPPPAPLPIPGASRFRFSCGETQSSPPRRQDEEAAFPSFWEKNAPQLSGGQEGSSISIPGAFARLYAWGPSDGAWSRAGRAQVMFVNPWDVMTVRTTAPTLQLFSSSLDAQTRLGLVDRSTGFRFSSMDPDGRSGVMLLRGAATTELLVFEENKPLEIFEGAHEQGYRNLAGAVQSRSSFFAAFEQGTKFAIVKLAGGRVQPVADFNLGNTGERGVQLVRTDRGDLGVAIEGDTGLFVYPVSEEGELGEPIIALHEAVKGRVCPPEARGFIVDRDLAVTPYLDSFDGELIPATRVRAKMIVGYGRACIEGLRTHGRGFTEISDDAPNGASLPFAILSSDSDGKRLQMICQ